MTFVRWLSIVKYCYPTTIKIIIIIIIIKTLSRTSKPAVSRRGQGGVRAARWSKENSKVFRHCFWCWLLPIRHKENALDLVTAIGWGIAAVTHHPRSTMFLHQRLSVAVQVAMPGVSWEHSRTMSRATRTNYLNYNNLCQSVCATVFRILFGASELYYIGH